MVVGRGIFDAVENYLAAAFLAVVFFAVVVFAVVVFFAAGFFVADFFAVAVNFTPASLAILCNLALRRAAVFFFSKSFLTALSYSD